MLGRTGIMRTEIDYSLSYTQRGERDAHTNDDKEPRRTEGLDEGHCICGASFLPFPSLLPPFPTLSRPGNSTTSIKPSGETHIEFPSDRKKNEGEKRASRLPFPSSVAGGGRAAPVVDF